MSPVEHTDADQALRWFTRLHSGDATAEERGAFEAWRDGSLHRQRAYAQVAALWADLDGLRERPFPALEQVRKEWAAGGAPRSRRWPQIRAAAALAATVAAVVAGIWWWELFGVGVHTADYRTAVGEQRTVTLQDGSSVVLNTATRVTVRLSRMSREVILHDGEALFAVTHDPQRPFLVEAGNGTAQDVGTRYTVRRKNDKTLVAVLEGLVEVRTKPHEPATSERRLLREGEGASYGPDGRISPTVPVNGDLAAAWLQGKLVFERARLGEVLAEVARYRTDEIRLLDPSLASLEVSGAFNVRELDAVPHALEAALPVKASRAGPHLIVIEQTTAR